MTARPLAVHFLPAYVWLALIVLAYVALALAYARVTPAWQAPDEPAHYNYVAYVAEHGQLPVLRQGDYPGGSVPGPQARWTDISQFRYESHQPPLFYALGAAVYKLQPGVFGLRALSVLIGAALLPVVFLCARLALPGQPWLWLGCTAFAAFIPMHLFDAGSVENDTLANLVMSLLLLAYLALAAGWRGRWRWAIFGLLLGAAALTKVTIYLPAALLIVAALTLGNKGRAVAGWMRAAGVVTAVAAAASGWWFVRNGLIYGWTDLLAQARQAQVAGAQEHTGALGASVAQHFVVTSFESFWGQFGWMSIPLPGRDYGLLIALTGLSIAGWVWIALRRRKTPWGSRWIGLGLVLTWAGVVAGVIGYNLTFVQPQGRYLFPALAPIALFYVLGFAALFPRRLQPAAVAALSLGLLAFSAYTLQHDLAPAFQ